MLDRSAQTECEQLGQVGRTPLFCWNFSAATLSLVLIALALAPTSWSAAIAVSGLHGVAIMKVSALFSFSSVRLFPGLHLGW